MRFRHGPRQLESCDRLFPGDRGKALEKLVEGVAGFEVIEQRFDGNTRADENGRSAEDLGIAVHNPLFVGHHSTPV